LSAWQDVCAVGGGFLAITQLVIYVGGILVLILFGVMLTNKVFNVDIKTGTLQTLPALVLTAVMAGVLCAYFSSRSGRCVRRGGPVQYGTGHWNSAHDRISSSI